MGDENEGMMDERMEEEEEGEGEGEEREEKGGEGDASTSAAPGGTFTIYVSTHDPYRTPSIPFLRFIIS